MPVVENLDWDHFKSKELVSPCSGEEYVVKAALSQVVRFVVNLWTSYLLTQYSSSGLQRSEHLLKKTYNR